MIGKVASRGCWRDFGRRLAALRGDQAGSVLVLFALTLPVLVGVVGLGVEASYWYRTRQNLQTAADAGALAGALERSSGNSAGIDQAVAHDAGQNGFTAGGTSTLTVNTPPKSGPYAGDINAVEVIVTQRLPRLFSAVLISSSPVVSARAVAQVTAKGQACVLALDSSASGAITVQGNAEVEMEDCLIAANSTSRTAITVSGSSELEAQSLWTPGNYSVSGAARMELEKPATTSAWPLNDPYGSMQIAPPSGCTMSGARFNHGSTTLSPGVYCNGLTINGQASVTLDPGTYYIDSGDLTVNGQASLTCDCGGTGAGVTIVLTSSNSASDIGSLTINGGGQVVLKAPSDAGSTYPGMVLMQDPRATSGNSNRINGTANVRLTGAIHFPAGALQWSGNSEDDGRGCLQIVARTVTFIGNSDMEIAACQDDGSPPIVVSAVHLVE